MYSNNQEQSAKVHQSIVGGFNVTDEIEELLLNTKKGDVKSCCFLGYRYYIGDGVEKSYEESYKWIRIAAEKGDPWAQNFLGNLFLEGKGVKQSYGEAIVWYIKSAEQGDSDSMVQLYWIYHTGTGVEISYEESFKWIRMAAEKEDPYAEYFYATSLLEGSGTEKSIEEGLKWLIKSAEGGYALAQLKLGLIYGKGTIVENDWSKAAEWTIKAADNGEIGCYDSAGQIYENGWGNVEKSEKEAFRLYSLGAEKGDPAAMYHLSLMYRDGRYVPKSPGKARELLIRSASSDYEDALFDIATEALEEDKYKFAIDLLLELKSKGNEKAIRLLGALDEAIEEYEDDGRPEDSE